METPTLLYGSETWILNARDKSRTQASEMRFLRSVKGCTREDKIRNEEIREELRIYNSSEKIEDYHDRWVEHLERMEMEDSPEKHYIIYQGEGEIREDLGRDGVGTGSRLNLDRR
jgi:hypothetical protein